jgi:hypothetical protein
MERFGADGTLAVLFATAIVDVLLVLALFPSLARAGK